MCAKKLTVCQLNLPHGTKKHKTEEVKKKLKTQRKMAVSLDHAK